LLVEKDSLVIYFNEISKIKVLSKEEEIILFKKARNGDKESREKLITSNLKFVVMVAKKFSHFHNDIYDLISEGNIGLIKAFEKFDLSKGCRFTTYALWWIRQSILRYITDFTRTIRIPTNKHHNLLKLIKAKENYESIEDISSELKIDVSDARRLLDISREPLSLDSLASNEEDCYLLDIIEDNKSKTIEEIILENNLKEQIDIELNKYLNERQISILKYKFGILTGSPKSLQETGEIFHITRERVRQIIHRCFFTLKRKSKILKDAACDICDGRHTFKDR
jgi:RNA polymerase primary sigma factor